MENQKKHTGRRVLAGFISFLITWLLIAEGLMLSLKLGVFKTTSISGLFEELNVYDDLRDVVSEVLKPGEGGLLGGLDIGIPGLEDLDTDKLISDEMMNDIVGLIEDSVMNGKEADLSKVIDKHKDTLISNFCEQAVDKAIGDVGNVVSQEKLESVGWISEMSQQYDMNLSKEIMDVIKEDYTLSENGELDLNKVDKKEVAEKIAASVKKEASDKIDEEIQRYIKDINASFNDALGNTSSIDVPKKAGVVCVANVKNVVAAGAALPVQVKTAEKNAAADMSIGDIMKKATDILELMSRLIVIFAVVLVVLIALEILLYIKIGIGWLKNLSVSCLTAGVVHIIVYFVVNTLKDSILNMDLGIDSAAIMNLLTNLVNKCVGGLLGVVIAIGITLTVLGVVGLVVYIVVNKKLKKKNSDTDTDAELPAAAV